MPAWRPQPEAHALRDVTGTVSDPLIASSIMGGRSPRARTASYSTSSSAAGFMQGWPVMPSGWWHQAAVRGGP